MGQAIQTPAQKSQKEKLKQEYNAALKLLAPDLPRLKAVFDIIAKCQNHQAQCIEFKKLLFRWYYSLNNTEMIPSTKENQLVSLSQGIFYAFTPSERQTMKFDHFIVMCSKIFSQDFEVKFEFAWRMYASANPEIDQVTKKEYISAIRFLKIGIKRFGISEDHASDFFTHQLEIVKERKIYKDEFRQWFEVFNTEPYFSFMDQFHFSFKGLQNAQEFSSARIQPLEESIDFTSDEYKVLDDFFEKRIAVQTDLEMARKQFSELLSDRSINSKLRNRLIESFLYASDSNLYYDKKIYFKIAKFMFKERDEVAIINFIFDIFTKYSKDEIMNAKEIKEVLSVFSRKNVAPEKVQKISTDQSSSQSLQMVPQLVRNHSLPQQINQEEDEDLSVQIQHLQSLDRSTFLEQYFNFMDHTPQFKKLRTILYVELGARPESGRQEREIIETMLNDSLNLNEFIIANMQKGDSFYIINKKFWDQWEGVYTQSTMSKASREAQFKMDNESLFKLKGNTLKLVPLKLNENIVILPIRVWDAFTFWYGRTEVIKRTVIEYPSTQRKKSTGLQKSQGQTILELEVDLLRVRIGKLQDNGDYPAQVQTIYVSPKLTLRELRDKIARTFKIRDSQTQLWMKDEVLLGQVMASSIEQNKEINDGMKFFIEEMLEDKRWPSDGTKIKKGFRHNLNEFKTVGCYNLGNTCYINSVIQCVTNTHYFKDYFLRHIFIENKEFKFSELPTDQGWKFIESKKDLIYSNQINLSNPMGFQGKIVLPFASLIEDLYTSKFTCINEPRKFKKAMGRFHEQFSTTQQQDAQEFLVILLDSLHEELNIRQTKPYIVNPDSNGRDEQELAMQIWSNFLHRNWSFIIFLFYGQIRSYLKCVECNREKISFEIFSTISLPLPESSLINFTIVISLLPYEIKCILSDKQYLSSHLKDQLDSQRRRATFSFDVQEQNIQALTKERPILLSVSLPPSTNMRELTAYIASKMSVLKLEQIDARKQQKGSTEIVYSLQNEQLLIIYPETQLNQIREGTTIYASELLTSFGKEQVREFYQENWDDIMSYQTNVLINFVPPEEPYESIAEENIKLIVQEVVPDIFAVKQQEPINRETNFFDQTRQLEGKKVEEIKQEVIPLLVKLETQYFEYARYQMRSQQAASVDYSTYCNRSQNKDNQNNQIEYTVPDQILVYFVNRKILMRDIYLTTPNKYFAKVFTPPFFLLINHQSTGKHIHEEVWMKTRFMLNLTSNKFFQDKQNLWWNQEDQNKTQLTPFVIKFVKGLDSENSQKCSICNENCFGCMLQPSNNRSIFGTLKDKCFLAIDWNLEFLQQYFNQQFLKPIELESFKDNNHSIQEVQLTDCLKMFESVEEIPVRENVNCDKCKNVTHHQRRLSVQKAPPILIIHLKRFKIVNNNSKKKIDQYVNFPLRDLDMSPFLHTPAEESGLYDLYAVINHYGSLNGGHYTAFVRNERTRMWTSYDDSYLKDLPESKIRSPFAYILFYARKDLDKKPLESVYPSIESVFKGKPVRFRQEFGSKMFGYVAEVPRKEDGIMKVKVDSSIEVWLKEKGSGIIEEGVDRDNIDIIINRDQEEEEENNEQGEEKKEVEKKLDKKKKKKKDQCVIQ